MAHDSLANIAGQAHRRCPPTIAYRAPPQTPTTVTIFAHQAQKDALLHYAQTHPAVPPPCTNAADTPAAMPQNLEASQIGASSVCVHARAEIQSPLCAREQMRCFAGDGASTLAHELWMIGGFVGDQGVAPIKRTAPKTRTEAGEGSRGGRQETKPGNF